MQQAVRGHRAGNHWYGKMSDLVHLTEDGEKTKCSLLVTNKINHMCSLNQVVTCKKCRKFLALDDERAKEIKARLDLTELSLNAAMLHKGKGNLTKMAANLRLAAEFATEADQLQRGLR